MLSSCAADIGLGMVYSFRQLLTREKDAALDICEMV